jgi:UDP-N-acetylglucosamine 2-epimerase
MSSVLSVFGTRPEVIKLAPVIRELEARGNGIQTTNVASGQHRELVEPSTRGFDLRVDHDLGVMEPGQPPTQLCARILEALDPVLQAIVPELALVFPVHPNPAVVATADAVLQGRPRIRMVEPLGYPDFVHLVSRAHVVVSDSGGVQEEAPTLGKPLIVLRTNTERPEALSCGVARLLGPDPGGLRRLLEEALDEPPWARRAHRAANPFGDGDAARRIASVIRNLLAEDLPLAATGAR